MSARRSLPSLLLAALVLLVSVAEVGCRRSDAGKEPEVVRIGYIAHLTQAQVLLGLQSGELARAVLPSRIETRVFNAGPSLVEALFAGEVDIGYVGPAPVLGAHVQSKGAALRVIAGSAANGVLVVARRDSGIRTMADLAGKRIATPQLGNSQDLSARHYVRSSLGTTDLSNVLPFPTAEHAALLSRGQVDASWVVEPWGSRMVEENGAVLLAEEKDLWPSKRFTQTVVVASTSFLSDHPDKVERVLAVHHAWTEKLRADATPHLPALGEALFAATGKRLPPKLLARAIAHVEFTDDPLEDSLRTMAAWSHDIGLSRASADTSSLVDTTLLKKVAP